MSFQERGMLMQMLSKAATRCSTGPSSSGQEYRGEPTPRALGHCWATASALGSAPGRSRGVRHLLHGQSHTVMSRLAQLHQKSGGRRRKGEKQLPVSAHSYCCSNMLQKCSKSWRKSGHAKGRRQKMERGDENAP